MGPDPTHPARRGALKLSSLVDQAAEGTVLQVTEGRPHGSRSPSPSPSPLSSLSQLLSTQVVIPDGLGPGSTFQVQVAQQPPVPMASVPAALPMASASDDRASTCAGLKLAEQGQASAKL